MTSCRLERRCKDRHMIPGGNAEVHVRERRRRSRLRYIRKRADRQQAHQSYIRTLNGRSG
jgi:hypothetical protein